ncbi:vacuolar protein sorting-associated protein 13, partial [Aureobasidium melanogenum]
DVLTAYLGELYASNEFLPLDDSKDSDTANKLTAGVHNTRLTSTFNYPNDQVEELDLIDKVDLDFRITSAEHRPGYKRPDTEIEGSMSNVNLRITEAQLKFILELSRSIPEAFAADPDDEIEEHVKEELPATTVQDAKAVSGDSDIKEEEQPQSPTHLGPEIGSDDDTWTKLDLVFKVGTIGLELISSKPTKPVGDLAASSLSKFSLNETHVKLRMVSDGSLESELLVQSFTITDTRTHEKNKFRKIMSLINTDVKQQFMASVSISGGKERNLIALLTIDSPRIILALDYLFAVQHFVNAGLTPDEPLIISDEDESSAGEEDVASMSTSTDLAGARQPETKSTEDASSMSVSFRVNIVDAQIILIANPAITNSEAIV